MRRRPVPLSPDLDDPDDVTEAERVMVRLGLPDEMFDQVLAEIRGGAKLRARERYLAEGAKGPNPNGWYPGIWRRQTGDDVKKRGGT